MKKVQMFFWLGVAVFVGHIAITQDATPEAKAYMARVDFVNGTGPAQPVDVAVVDVQQR